MADGLTLSVQIDGLSATITVMEQMAERALAPFAGGTGESMHLLLDVYLTERFASQGRAFGGIAWAPLAPGTVKQKARKGEGGQIGMATGALFSSWTSASADSIREVQGAQIVRGSALPYAEFFDAVRPVLQDPLPPDVTDALLEMAATYVATGTPPAASANA